MIPAPSFEEIEETLKNSARWSKEPRVAGLLFIQPTSSLARDEIIPKLEYFHHRSGDDVHFFCGGFSGYANVYPDNQLVATIDGIKWYFSPSQFNKLRREIETRTSWIYSGGDDLLLVDVNNLPNQVRLDFSTRSAYLFRLDQMKQDGIIIGVGQFFEEIFRFAEDYKGDNAVKKFISPPEISRFINAPRNIGILVGRMGDAWKRSDYPAVVHACATILETMAKDVLRNPAIENQPLGSFIQSLYRNPSHLSQQDIDNILDIYNKRNSAPLAGHGATRPPNISQQDAKAIMRITDDIVRKEYSARVSSVGR